MTTASSITSTLLTEITRYLSQQTLPEMDDVLSGIRRWTVGAPGKVMAQSIPAISHMPAALAAMADRNLAQAIEAAVPHLRWITYDGYPPEDIGAAFANGHAFTSLMGGGAPYPAEDFDLGLFLIAPRTLYRDHKHAAPELYAPLTGPHGWRFLPDRKVQYLSANVPVWNKPFAPHATLTGDVPFLCIFCWTSDVKETATVIPCDDWSQLTPAGQ